MQQTSFPVEYGFKTTELDLINKKTGKIKSKYKCLPLMITLPLTRPLNSLGPPNQTDPLYKQTVLKSTSNTNGWLNFIPIDNKQPNIISIQGNILYINKFSYNYDISVDIINKGKNEVDLRFMAENPFSFIAANMNDLNLNETSFSNIYDGQQIKFTITGEYQFFYINYPTTDFDINITITVSNTKTPVYICKNKSKGCTCFDIEGNGYIKIKNKCVPVYSDKILGNQITRYLYPEFNYLRDLFYNITLANSLDPPDTILKNPIKSEIIKLLPSPTILTCNITDLDIACLIRLWGSYILKSGDLVSLDRSNVACPLNEFYETKLGGYRYSWSNSPPLVSTTDLQAPAFNLYYQWGGGWYKAENASFPLSSIQTTNGYDYSLPAGSYERNSGYKLLAFGISSGNINSAFLHIISSSTFEINISQI